MFFSSNKYAGVKATNVRLYSWKELLTFLQTNALIIMTKSCTLKFNILKMFVFTYICTRARSPDATSELFCFSSLSL